MWYGFDCSYQTVHICQFWDETRTLALQSKKKRITRWEVTWSQRVQLAALYPMQIQLNPEPPKGVILATRDGRWVSVADTRQQVGMAPFLQNTGGYPKGYLRLEGFPSSQQGTCTSTAWRVLDLVHQDIDKFLSDSVMTMGIAVGGICWWGWSGLMLEVGEWLMGGMRMRHTFFTSDQGFGLEETLVSPSLDFINQIGF
jgi:hypothetical protein